MERSEQAFVTSDMAHVSRSNALIRALQAEGRYSRQGGRKGLSSVLKGSRVRAYRGGFPFAAPLHRSRSGADWRVRAYGRQAGSKSSEGSPVRMRKLVQLIVITAIS